MSLSIQKGQTVNFLLTPELTCLNPAWNPKLFYLEFQFGSGTLKGFYSSATLTSLNGYKLEFYERPTDDLINKEINLGNVDDAGLLLSIYEANDSNPTTLNLILQQRIRIVS